MSDPGITLYDPTAEPRKTAVKLARRLTSLAGTRAGILDNGKANAGTLMLAVVEISKRRVKEFLFEHARLPLARLGAEYRQYQIERRGAVDASDTMVPIVRAAEDLSVIVVGGAGKHSCWQPTFGSGTQPVRRTIARRDGTPLRRVADLAR